MDDAGELMRYYCSTLHYEKHSFQKKKHFSWAIVIDGYRKVIDRVLLTI